MDSQKLGLWIAKNEGAKFWLSVMTELKNRGLQDILLPAVRGLRAFLRPLKPFTDRPRCSALCTAHQVRHSLRYLGWKERKAVAADLRAIYNAVHLEGFAAKWDEQYPTISQSWKKNWAHLIAIFDFAPEIRKAIYTSNAIESLNALLRKVTKTRRVFPTDESVLKLLYSGPAQYLGKMDDAHQGLETRHESIYADVWSPGDTMTIWPFTHTQKILQILRPSFWQPHCVE